MSRAKRRQAQQRYCEAGKPKPSRKVVAGEIGPPCPRCKQPTEVNAHREIGPKLLRQACYFTRWHRCRNPDCVTTLIMPEEFRVWNDRDAELAFYRREWVAKQLQRPAGLLDDEADDQQRGDGQ